MGRCCHDGLPICRLGNLAALAYRGCLVCLALYKVELAAKRMWLSATVRQSLTALCAFVYKKLTCFPTG
jgi:hypothetical protein